MFADFIHQEPQIRAVSKIWS